MNPIIEGFIAELTKEAQINKENPRAGFGLRNPNKSGLIPTTLIDFNKKQTTQTVPTTPTTPTTQQPVVGNKINFAPINLGPTAKEKAGLIKRVDIGQYMSSKLEKDLTDRYSNQPTTKSVNTSPVNQPTTKSVNTSPVNKITYAPVDNTRVAKQPLKGTEFRTGTEVLAGTKGNTNSIDSFPGNAKIRQILGGNKFEQATKNYKGTTELPTLNDVVKARDNSKGTSDSAKYQDIINNAYSGKTTQEKAPLQVAATYTMPKKEVVITGENKSQPIVAKGLDVKGLDYTMLTALKNKVNTKNLTGE